MADEDLAGAEHGLLAASEADWALARTRAGVVRELASMDAPGHEAVDRAALALDLSRRQTYSLLSRWRAGEGRVSDLLPRRSSGGRGKSRLPDDVEAVIKDVLRKRYLKRQRPSVASVHRSIVRACRVRGLIAPSRGAVERRIAVLDPRVAAGSRGGPDAARKVDSAGGSATTPVEPLGQVQIDHTVIDVVLVDEQDRAPIGRPFLTVGVDVATRAIVGMVVTLDPPSATSVGLCLAHIATDKQAWLETLGAQVSWPMAGKPAQLYVDNGAEFHSEALRRGCEEHGIALDYRPPGEPHYGGVVERLIGTLMSEVHELPGTTFSNPADRGPYDSDATAALTLLELQRWLAFVVAAYHHQVHEGHGRPPLAVWEEKATAHPPTTVANPRSFLIDFLPVVRRRLTRTGLVIDHVQYFSDTLKPLIARRQQIGQVVVRRDPRDLSRVWVLDPQSNAYLSVGYRHLAHPAISLWEHRAAVARLREKGRGEVDEQALFASVEQMRHVSDTARKSTRRARRERQRRPVASTPSPGSIAVPPPPPDLRRDARAEGPAPAPFDDIEEW